MDEILNNKLNDIFAEVLKAVYNVDLTKQDIIVVIDKQLKELHKLMTERQFKELTSLGKLYNGSKIIYLDYYEERYKYLKNKLESLK